MEVGRVQSWWWCLGYCLFFGIKEHQYVCWTRGTVAPHPPPHTQFIPAKSTLSFLAWTVQSHSGTQISVLVELVIGIGASGISARKGRLRSMQDIYSYNLEDYHGNASWSIADGCIEMHLNEDNILLYLCIICSIQYVFRSFPPNEEKKTTFKTIDN